MVSDMDRYENILPIRMLVLIRTVKIFTQAMTGSSPHRRSANENVFNFRMKWICILVLSVYNFKIFYDPSTLEII